MKTLKGRKALGLSIFTVGFLIAASGFLLAWLGLTDWGWRLCWLGIATGAIGLAVHFVVMLSHDTK
jgi:hypothetical protein